MQEHHATRLHFDFRIEHEGVLKSWAVTREPSSDPTVRRLAIETEDHPLEYGKFEGEIPKGEYGAGQVRIWDRGTYLPEKDIENGYEQGKIEVLLKGRKLQGRYVLVRISGEGGKSQWLFFKARPRIARLKVPEVPPRKRLKSLKKKSPGKKAA